MVAKISLETARANLQHDIQKARLQYQIINKVLPALKPFDGKQVTRRMATAVKAALPDFVTTYHPPGVSYWLYIWGEGLPYDQRMSLRLGGNTGLDYPRFNYDHFITDQCAYYLKCADHAARMEQMLAWLPTMVQRYNDAVDALEAAEKEFGDAKYSVTRCR